VSSVIKLRALYASLCRDELVCTRSVPKVMRMIKKIFYSTYMQLQFILFKIGSLWSNTAIPALLPLEVFTWDDVQSPCRSCLDIFNCPKMSPLGGFWAWGIKINRTEPSQRCTVGGEVVWYYFEPKIPTHQTNSSGPVSHTFFSCADLP